MPGEKVTPTIPAPPPRMDAQDEELRSWLSGCGIPSLPYTEGKVRLRPTPCVIPSRRMRGLRAAATAICRVYDEMCDILARDPSHLTEFFSLTPLQTMLWYSSGSLWHGIARADVFCTTDGRLAVAEVNSDTPSGADEAWLLGEFAAPRYPGFLNPNSHFKEAFLSVISEAQRGLTSRPAIPAVALIYPTDIPEDQGMLTIYKAWLETAGYRVLLGSPSNLELSDNGRASLFGTEIDVLFRHYKTDWWCERTNVWRDARAIPDPAPLARELQIVIGQMTEGRLAVVNPFGAVVTQNKLSLAFFHELMNLFSRESQDSIRRYVPATLRLSSAERGMLEREKDDWVLKSDYGCEGAEVIVGRLTDADAWKNALDLAEPRHWIVQRYFQAERQDSGLTENYGVYVAGGVPAGMYVRLSGGVTGTTAVVVPALVRPPLARMIHRADVLVEQHSSFDLDARVRDLMGAYTTSSRWLSFRMCLLLRSASHDALCVPFRETRGTRAAAAAGETLARMLARAERDVPAPVLVIADLDGVESAAFAAGIAPAAEVVLQVENIAHPRESVPLRSTLGALIHYAPLVIRRRPRETPASGAIILERRRMDPFRGGPGRFNNRHWAYLPPTRTLEELGIGTILYVHPDDDGAECDDLNEDFVQYARAGIRLCYASPHVITSAGHAEIRELLCTTERTPSRRPTIFTYMLPREEAGTTFTYNPERVES